MAVDIAQLGFEVDPSGIVKATKALQDLTETSKETGKAQRDVRAELSATATKLGEIAARITTAGLTATAALVGRSVQLATEANEVARVFQYNFAGSVREADMALAELAKDIPLTRTQLRDLANIIQSGFKAAGVARGVASDMAIELTRVAKAVGDFQNVDIFEVARSIQAGVNGVTDALGRFNINISQGKLEAIAYRDGIAEVGEILTDQQRAQAAYIAITEQTRVQMAALTNETLDWKEQLKRLRRDFMEMEIQIGQAILPLLVEFTSKLMEADEDGLSPFQKGLIATGKAVMTLVSAFIIVKEAGLAVGELLVGLGAAVGNSLMAIASPVTEFISTMQNATQRVLDRDLGGALAEFEGIGERIGNSYQGYVKEADTALRFIGDSFEERVRSTAATVNDLMNTFDQVADDFLNEGDLNLGNQDWIADGELGDEIAARVERLMKVKEAYAKVVADLQGQMNPFIAAQNRLYAALKQFDELEELSFGMVDTSEGRAAALEQYRQTVIALRDDMLDLKEETDDWDPLAALREIEEIVDPGLRAVRQLAEQMKILKTLKRDGIIDQDEFDRLAAGLERAAGAAFSLGDAMETWGGSVGDMLRSIQNGVERGSDAYATLELAVIAANYVQAIGAILNQAQGDPWTAPMRMAAMAATVSALIGTAITVSGMGGGGPVDPTAQRQAELGTGGVFGDPTAQTQSIMNSLDIIANATEQLPGLNRDMLRAFTTLADAITGATTVLAGQIQSVNFAPVKQPGGLGSFFGGVASVVDEGIILGGGMLADAIEGITVEAFREVSKRKHFFDDFDNYLETEELDESVGREFGRVIGAIADTVSEAATVLGFSAEEIQRVFDNFEVWEQTISLEDLSVEEQQQALQAHFSQIFDSLAHEVVPFIESFRQLGEGAGETLVRMATSIQVFDYAIEQLGFQFSRTLEDHGGSLRDFRYASIQAKMALVDLVGGLDEFIDGVNAFIDAFASDEQKFQMTLDAITMRFDELGLELPETRDGIWELMQSMDANTEAGRAGIAMLLEATPLLEAYYDAIEEGEQRRLAMLEGVQAFIGAPGAQMQELTNRFKEAMEAAKELGATHREYSLIIRSFNRQLERLTAELTRSVLQQTQALFGEQAQEAAAEFERGFDNVRKVSNSLFGEWQRALTNLKGFADSLLLNDQLTPLNPTQRLGEAQRQFEDTLRRAMAGDVDAATDLPDIAREFLDIARFMFASTGEYTEIFNRVQEALRGVEMPPGIEEYTIEIERNTRRTADILSNEISQQQQEMIFQLDRLIAAMDLANTLGELAFTLDRSPVEIAQELGVPLRELATALGIDLSSVSAETVYGIANMAERLGADIYGLAEALGVDIQSMAHQFGIDIGALNFSTQFDREIDSLNSILEQNIEQTELLRILANGLIALPEARIPDNREPVGARLEDPFDKNRADPGPGDNAGDTGGGAGNTGGGAGGGYRGGGNDPKFAEDQIEAVEESNNLLTKVTQQNEDIKTELRLIGQVLQRQAS